MTTIVRRPAWLVGRCCVHAHPPAGSDHQQQDDFEAARIKASVVSDSMYRHPNWDLVLKGVDLLE
jgi:hypothetical protein